MSYFHSFMHNIPGPLCSLNGCRWKYTLSQCTRLPPVISLKTFFWECICGCLCGCIFIYEPLRGRSLECSWEAVFYYVFYVSFLLKAFSGAVQRCHRCD
ncbi:hypothetical protein FKM82_000046 [Ascaphus truei]